MIKSTLREPIHLANIRKKTKGEEKVPFRREERKNSIQYDLQIFQESLNIHQENKSELFSWQHFQTEQQQNSKEELSNESNIFFKNDTNYNNELKNNINRTQFLQTEQAFIQKNLISSVSSNYSSMHKTKTCFKPYKGQNQNKENNNQQCSIKLPKTSITGGIHNLKSDVLKEIKMSNNINDIAKKQKNIFDSPMKQAYERKIKQLELKNEESQRKIQSLEIKLKEKEQIASRVDQIQKDLNNLYEQNKQLQKMNESLSKLSLISEEHQVADSWMQTDVFPLYVNDSFSQTIPEEIDFRQSSNFQGVFQQIKYWKHEIERKELKTVNKYIENKAIVEDKDESFREKINLPQRHLQTLNMNYEYKNYEISGSRNLATQNLFERI